MGINRDREVLRDLTDTERRLSNTVFMATIAKLDAKRSLLRLRAGPIYSDWIPYMTLRAGPDRSWHIPEPGEQVLVAAPGGDINQAVILGGVYQEAFPQPEDDEDISAMHWKDESFLRYDRKQHQWHLKLPHDGDAHILLEIGRTTLLMKDSETVLTTPRFFADVAESASTLEMTARHTELFTPRVLADAADGTSTLEMTAEYTELFSPRVFASAADSASTLEMAERHTEFFVPRFKVSAANEASVQEMSQAGTTLTTPDYTVDAPSSSFTGTLLVRKLLNYLKGLTGQGGATIEGNVHVVGNVTATGKMRDDV